MKNPLKTHYDRHILPHLIEYACGMGEIMKSRSKVVPHAEGRVLEIGIGTGLNLSFYDAGKVTSVTGVDPAAEMHHRARRRAAKVTIPVETIALELGEIQAESKSFDSIVCTFTLCTIPDVAAAFKEMRRVLKPGGKAMVLEFSEVAEPLLRPLYDIHSFEVLPRLGKLFANDADSYQYLAESIRKHPNQETLKAMMQDAGLDRCDYRNLSAGIVAIHSGFRA